jgi:predicted nucleotidyltransferase
MTTTLLDVSRRRDLGSHAELVADVEAAAAPLSIAPVIVGAFARDLHLWYGHGIETQRDTEDVDFALAVPDWSAFGLLRTKLIESGRFSSSAAPHHLRHRNGLPIDLVPFGGVETRDRKIAWPPRGDTMMDVFGFREALVSVAAQMRG